MVLSIWYRRKLGVGGGIAPQEAQFTHLHFCLCWLSFKCLLWVFRSSSHAPLLKLILCFRFIILSNGDYSIIVIYFSGAGSSPPHAYAMRSDKHRSISRVACNLWSFFTITSHFACIRFHIQWKLFKDTSYTVISFLERRNSYISTWSKIKNKCAFHELSFFIFFLWNHKTTENSISQHHTMKLLNLILVKKVNVRRTCKLKKNKKTSNMRIAFQLLGLRNSELTKKFRIKRRNL